MLAILEVQGLDFGQSQMMDNDRIYALCREHVGCACGDGVIDWSRIVGRLKEAGYDGVLSVECGTEEEAVRSLAHLQGVLQKLDA